MYQTRKGNKWYFAMMAALQDLLHGEETQVWNDSAYAGQEQTIKQCAPNARDFTKKKGNRHVQLSEDDKARNRSKSTVRAKVEHAIHVFKRQFGFTKVRFRGLD